MCVLVCAQVGVVIQDVAVIVAAVVHAVVVKFSKGSCDPGRLTSAAFMALKTPVTTRFPAYATAAVLAMFAVCVMVPSIIGVRNTSVPRCSTVIDQ